MISITTIGFTKTTARRFFQRLSDAEIKLLIDVRLNNTSQLSGFAKAKDLQFFVKRLCGADYVHRPELAPTDVMLKKFKKEKGNWGTYREEFLNLMQERAIENTLNKDELDQGCLLCSEAEPHNCHRALVCDYLNGKWGSILNVKHL